MSVFGYTVFVESGLELTNLFVAEACLLEKFCGWVSRPKTKESLCLSSVSLVYWLHSVSLQRQ
jgi:hypothetical protein